MASSPFPAGIHLPIANKKIKLWDDSNHTHANPEDKSKTYREVVLNNSTGANPTTFTLPKEIKYVSGIRLEEILLPTLFYNITSTQTLTAYEDADGTPILLSTGTFTAGVWTQSDVLTVLNAMSGVAAAVSSKTGLLTITVTGTDDKRIDFLGAPQLASLLGFTSAVDYIQTSGVFVGDRPLNMYPTNILHVRSSALTRMYIDSVVVTTNPMDQNTAFTIPFNYAPSPSYFSYETNDRRMIPCYGNDMQTIDISITDSAGTPLDMHDQPYMIKISVETDDFQKR